MKRKKKIVGFLTGFILILVCMFAGYLIGSLDLFRFSEDVDLSSFVSSYLLQVFLLFLSFYLQIIIHEGGHLVAGLLTGYRFSSFRIGSVLLLKNHDGFSFKRFFLAGTGGQCLLIPPKKNANGSYPFKLYHLGGVIFNLITALLFFILYRFALHGLILRMFFLYLSVSGILCAIMNGAPMRVSGVASDGYNVIHIGKEPFALEAMWLQLKINEAQTEGVRLKDLPDDWFVIPDHAAKNNEIISAVAVFSENRAMDQLDFETAKALIFDLQNSDEFAVIGLYQNLLLFDQVTIDLLENGENADVSALNSRQIKAFRKSMAKYPAVIRTEYAIQLLKEKNPSAANKYRKLFDSVAQKYPMKSDIDSEMEILACIDAASDQKFN
ncbi:MAG: M50 family metallopeptidase [Clostridia bacterium]|nr:M50 family metallopeptidase [Clostridia bacterium]